MADEQLIIEIRLDDGTVQKGFATIQRDAKQTGREIEKSFRGSLTKRLSQGVKSLRFEILSLGAAFASAFAGKKIIEAAIVQENAINQVNTSLKLAGRFSKEASQDFQNFASELQGVTTVGDETTLGLLSLAGNFARSNEEAKALTKAALDLSAATGISLEGAVKNLGKSLTGLAGELGESVAGIKDLTQEQLKAGDAIELVAKRFGGAAAAQVNTFSGALKQAENIFGDLLEELGMLIIKSPAIVAVIGQVSKQFTTLISSISGIRSEGDVFKNLILGSISFGQSIVTFVIAPIELAYNVLETTFNAIRVIYQTFLTGLANAVSRVVNLFAPNSALGQGLSDFASSTSSTLVDFANQTKDSIDGIFDFNVADKTSRFIDEYKIAVENAKAITEEANSSLTSSVAAQTDFLASNLAINVSLFDQFLVKYANTAEGAKKQTEDFVAEQKRLIDIFRSSFVSGISSAFSSFGNALATGKNGFQAFGKSVLGTLGSLALQMGQFFILVGAGLSATGDLFGLSGGGAIAAGIGLSILGGILQGLSGQGGGATSAIGAGGGGDSSGGGITTPEPTFPNETVRDQGSVVVNVEGTVLDPRGVGIQIAEILQETFGSNGVTVTA